ncbi:MAG: nitroreductase family protein [Bacteroidetes bacterium]|nr:nitroreductase family protein [Bacteroidota bacterium]MBU1677812.1 nitroreductase family protein [Bacteroidota bacterium]MBU2506213.1 nitroreductase family protein [Bacteroidota bacterium]
MSEDNRESSGIIDILKKRWSPRSFSNKNISDESLQRIFEAARWAPSCFNEQPWNFIYFRRGSESYNKLAAAIMDGNKPWSINAPVLVLTVARNSFERNGKSNNYAMHDLGMAVFSLTLQALSEDIYLHQLAGFDAKMTSEIFRIDDNFSPATVLAMGYLGDPEALPDSLKPSEKKRTGRKPISEFVFMNSWKKANNL